MSAIVIIHAGMSEESSTAKLARDIRDALVAGATEGTVSIEEVALRPLAHDIVDHVLTGFAPPRLEEALSVVGRADGIVALTPTYQASYSGLFKSFFDILDTDALRGTPVLLGAAGGTPRHSLVTEVAMRPLFTYAHADPVPTAIYAATEDWGRTPPTRMGRAGPPSSAVSHAEPTSYYAASARTPTPPTRPRRWKGSQNMDMGRVQAILS